MTLENVFFWGKVLMREVKDWGQIINHITM